MALGVKTGGRQKGTPNRTTAERAAEIAASGITPLEYLLNLLRDEEADPAIRFEAAKAAAPYVHPKLAAIAHSGGVGLKHEPGDSIALLMDAINGKTRTA